MKCQFTSMYHQEQSVGFTEWRYRCMFLKTARLQTVLLTKLLQPATHWRLWNQSTASTETLHSFSFMHTSIWWSQWWPCFQVHSYTNARNQYTVKPVLAVTSVMQLPASKGQCFETPKVHFNSKLTSVTQPSISKGCFILSVEWLLKFECCLW